MDENVLTTACWTVSIIHSEGWSSETQYWARLDPPALAFSDSSGRSLRVGRSFWTFDDQGACVYQTGAPLLTTEELLECIVASRLSPVDNYVELPTTGPEGPSGVVAARQPSLLVRSWQREAEGKHLVTSIKFGAADGLLRWGEVIQFDVVSGHMEERSVFDRYMFNEPVPSELFEVPSLG